MARPKERPKIENAAIDPAQQAKDEVGRPKESAGNAAPPPRPRRVHVALIPNLASLSPDAAKRRLYRRGLRYRTVGRIESDLPPGSIVKQTPEPALRVPLGKVVSVWIARPAPVATVKAAPPRKAVPRPSQRPRGRGQIAFVPDLSAMKLADAVALLKSRGLSHRRAGTIETDRLPGTVANQEPRADRRVPKGTRVAIWVARAPPKKSTQRVAKAARSSVRPPRPRPTRVARVPRLSRLTVAQAGALLKETGLRFRSAGTVESRLPPGTVAEQKPASGQRVKPGTVVSVWTASPALVAVPDLARRGTKQAIALLKRRGLRYRTAGTIESKRPPGSIARQSPGAGQRVKPNTVVALWTAKAALVQVPDLAGKPAAEARSMLVRRGLLYRSVASVESALPVGAVADQAPAAGKRVPAGTEITVLTARLPRVVVPDVGRMIPLQARHALRRRGLAYRIAGAVESELPPGWIVKQTPAAGKRVDQESVVSVWIAREPLVEVPDLSATRATAAAALLKKRGLRYRRAGTVDSGLPAGWVADQKPAAGKRVGKNTVVRIWTARPISVVGIPRVESTSTLWFGNRRIRLAGVRGLTGRFATSMASYIAGRKVRCRPTTVKAHRCEVDGHDLSEVVLFNGGGRAMADAGRNLRDAEAEARRAGRGVWRSRRRSAL